jgi:integrase
LKERGHHTGPDDYIFCHEDGQPILHMKTFPKMLGEAGLLCDSQGRKRSIYSLRHTYATFRLENGTNVYWLKQNMGTSVQMIERHYGQTKVLVGIEFETARRKKQKRRPDLAPPTAAMMAAPEPGIADDED